MQIIKRYCPEAILYKKITDYKNNHVAIDANLLIYKSIYAIRKNGYDLKNGDIIVTHIYSLLQKIIGLIKYNITPVFVFDGIAPKIKKETLNKRKKFSDLMKLKYTKAITQDEKKKYFFMKSDISFNEVEECKQLIELFGFSIIESPEEADAQLAYLSKNGIVDYIITDDMDILIFGGERLLKNFTISDKKKIQEINLDIILAKLNITQDELIELGILLGCDYCPSIAGIGTIGAYKLIKKYKNLDNMMAENIIKLNISHYKSIDYFKNPPIIEIKKINQLNINYTELVKFLKKFNYTDEFIKKIINKI